LRAVLRKFSPSHSGFPFILRLRFQELCVSVRRRRGESLIELIVALVILELAGAAALATALAVERFDRHAARGAADDAARWQSYRERETLPACTGAPAPDTVALLFPPTPDRPSLATVLRCGR
jgi:hypothetical protein